MEAATGKITVDPKRDKHIDLNMEITNIDRIATRVENLLNRVTGNHAPPAKEAYDDIEPTLATVLLDGPSQINDKCSRIYAALDQLEERLF